MIKMFIHFLMKPLCYSKTTILLIIFYTQLHLFSLKTPKNNLLSFRVDATITDLPKRQIQPHLTHFVMVSANADTESEFE